MSCSISVTRTMLHGDRQRGCGRWSTRCGSARRTRRMARSRSSTRRRFAFNPAALRAAAIGLAGADDFGSDSYMAALEPLLQSIEHEAELNALGRQEIWNRIVRALAKPADVGCLGTGQSGSCGRADRAAARHPRPAPHGIVDPARDARRRARNAHAADLAGARFRARPAGIREAARGRDRPDRGRDRAQECHGRRLCGDPFRSAAHPDGVRRAHHPRSGLGPVRDGDVGAHLPPFPDRAGRARRL